MKERPKRMINQAEAPAAYPLTTFRPSCQDP